MNAERYQRTRAIFEQACDVDAGDRDGLLDDLCGDDRDLRRSVVALLEMDSAMESGDAEPGLHGLHGMGDAGEPDLPESIGPYTINRVLGRGGTSVVYDAQQTNPNRRVALKVVSTLGVRGDLEKRFELEAQVMGSFTHPGIASVYETGRVNLGATNALYIAMELVQGQHLIDYVRRTDSDTERRIGLMMDVCEAIEHAHAQGVIHRDLKPGNIMVDETGHIKVLDFGIARITNPDSVEPTMHTEPGRIIGTLAYMSPEQLRGESHAVGVRSDVYALGVVFYQMLADRLPYEFKVGSLLNASRVHEHATHQRLGTIDTRLRGDLETIIDKALEKDPLRRYGSAGALREELRRFLNHEPIEARKPTAWYHARQFVRRHRAVSIGSMLAVAGLLAGVVALGVGLAGERDARRLAEEKSRVMQSMMMFVLNDMLEQADVRTSTDRELTVTQALENAADRIGERFPDDPIVAANIERMIGRSQVSLGLYDQAEPHLRRSIELFTRSLGADDHETFNAREELGVLLSNSSRNDEARETLTGLYEDRVRVLGADDPETLRSANDLGVFYSRIGEYQEARTIHEGVLTIRRTTEGELGFGTLLSQHNLALTMMFMGEFEPAAVIYEDIIPKREQTIGPDHPATLLSMNNLAACYMEIGDFARALTMFEQLNETQRRTLGPDHPGTLRTLGHIAGIQLKTDPAGAESAVIGAYQGRLRALGPEHMETLSARSLHARWLIAVGRQDEGLAELRATLDLQQSHFGAEHRDTTRTREALEGATADTP